jgi:hypothetical protein
MAITAASEFRVNSSTQFNQQRPVTTTLADGSFVVVWMDNGLGASSSLEFQHFDAQGHLIGAQTRFATTDYLFEPPSVGRLGDGGFVVAWQANSDIHMQRFSASGAAVGGEVQVSPDVNPTQHLASQGVTGLNDGGWLVSWRSDVDAFGYQQVYSQRYDANGATVGATPLTVQSEHIPIGSISVTSLLSGGWVATWDANGQILQRRYDAGGQPAGDGTPQLVAAVAGDPPHVAALADGGWVVVYPGEFSSLYAHRYDSTGHAAGDAMLVSSAATSSFGIGATVAGLAGGGYVVAWETTAIGGAIDIHAQRFDASGAKAGGEFQVNTETQSGQIDPAVTALQDGGFLVTWGSAQQDGSDMGVYAARFDANGVAQSNTGWLQGDASSDTIQWDGAQDARLSGYGGNDTLAGGPGNDFIDGGTGNDVLRIGAGHDNIDGGAGTDTALFDMSTAGITGYSRGLLTEYTVSTANGTFDLSNVDRAQFSNGLFALDTQAPINFNSGTGGNTWFAAALWNLGFGSLPGTADLSHWTARIDQTGGDHVALAQAMLDAYTPGGISNASLITYLFEVHAHRDPTDAELQMYMRQIAPSPQPGGGSAPWYATQGAFLDAMAQMPFNMNEMVGFTGHVQPLDPAAF